MKNTASRPSRLFSIKSGSSRACLEKREKMVSPGSAGRSPNFIALGLVSNSVFKSSRSTLNSLYRLKTWNSLFLYSGKVVFKGKSIKVSQKKKPNFRFDGVSGVRSFFISDSYRVAHLDGNVLTLVVFVRHRKSKKKEAKNF